MLSIYVHFPFCEKKCSYCNFVSFKCEVDTKQNYILKLLSEVRDKAKKYADKVSSIYFGGGTPTSVDFELIKSVLTEIYANFDVQTDAEITIEGNPATFDEKMLMKLSSIKFNRFSVGVQSFVDIELQSVDRLHSAHDAKLACELLNKYFPNYSLDLMIGLPFQTFETLEYSIQTATQLEPKHISCYMLSVEDGTKLQKFVASGKISVADDDKMADLYDFAVKLLVKNGFSQYETSNFARNGYQSNHNIIYWTMKNYIGLGISAHSLIGNRRFFNSDNLNEYISFGHRELHEETMSKSDFLSEYIMLALRLNQGINFVDFVQRFGFSFLEKYSKPIKKMKAYLDISHTNIAISQKYFSVASSIIIEFM